jgi:hypothetical protein
MSSATQLEPSPQSTPDGDRVREHTDPSRQRTIDQDTRARIERYRNASPADLDRRIEELEAESDMERVLETNASVLAFSGVLAGAFVNRRFLVLPIIVLAFLFHHARRGWCPPVPIFRRLGVRTRQEIDAERFALKAFRGDLDEFYRDRE